MSYNLRNTPNCIDEYVEVRDPTSSTPLVRLCGSGVFPIATPTAISTVTASGSSEPSTPPVPVLTVPNARVLLVFRYHASAAGAGLRVTYRSSGGALLGGPSLLALAPSTSLTCGPDTPDVCIGEPSTSITNQSIVITLISIGESSFGFAAGGNVLKRY